MRFLAAVLFLFIYMGCHNNEARKILKEVGLDHYGRQCSVYATCKNLVAINCNAAADGPLFYIDKIEKTMLMCCGGCCESTKREENIVNNVRQIFGHAHSIGGALFFKRSFEGSLFHFFLRI